MSQLESLVMCGATTIALDLVAGFLMAINIIVSRKRYVRWNRRAERLMRHLRDGRGNARKRLLFVAIAIAIAILLAFIGYGLYQDIPKSAFSAWRLASSSLLLILGALVGMGALLLISWGILRIISKWGSSNAVLAYSLTVITIVSWGLSVPAIMSLRFVPLLGVSFLVGFAFNSLLLGLLLGFFPLLIRLLALPGYRVVQLGLAIFIISKAIQLVQYYS